MVWSVVVAKMPAIAFDFSVGERFWLAGGGDSARPLGATLRIFYSFMIPIFGGRRWTAIAHRVAAAAARWASGSRSSDPVDLLQPPS